MQRLQGCQGAAHNLSSAPPHELAQGSAGQGTIIHSLFDEWKAPMSCANIRWGRPHTHPVLLPFARPRVVVIPAQFGEDILVRLGQLVAQRTGENHSACCSYPRLAPRSSTLNHRSWLDFLSFLPPLAGGWHTAAIALGW